MFIILLLLHGDDTRLNNKVTELGLYEEIYTA